MKKISADEVRKWRIELQNAEDFRDKEFGEFKKDKYSKAGENIDYFESGMSGRLIEDYHLDEPLATINIVYPIVKNIIPTLYWKNPYINAIPKRPEDEESAPYASAILNYYYSELDLKAVNRQIVFDAYVIGMGICKMGYTTRFGTMPDEENIAEEKKEKEKERSRGILERLGLKKPKPEEKPRANPELNEFIRSESPFVCWISPWDFLIDPTANSIETAEWVAHKIRKRLSDVKNNPNYKNTATLQGTPVAEYVQAEIRDSTIDDFKTIELYEIHYKTDEGINILTLAKDQNEYKELRHEESPYEMDGFQFEILYFNKHNHKLYPKGDIDIFKGLQDRINLTFENILDQVDRYVPKIIVDETAMTEDGKKALRDGNIGSICYANRDPNSVVKEANFTQVKGDLNALIEKILDIAMLETGLTRAQMMGMTSAETATEAQIGQAGQNLRLSDKFDLVNDFANRQARKLWQIIQQFVDFEEIRLITGDAAIDDVTGQAKFSWMNPIDSMLAEKLAVGDYRFDIEVGSTEKPDLPVLRKQVEGLANILMGEGVMMAFQMQGYKINIAELLKRYLKLFPDVFRDIGKIIQPIGPQTQGLMSPPQQPGQPGSARGPLSQISRTPPNMADIISANEGSKGQIPFA